MDIYERIKADHDEARDLMDQIKKVRSDKKRTELFEYFMRDMWLHHKLEEAVFYRTLAESRKTRDESFEAENEHHIANGLLEELSTMRCDTAQWDSKFGVLCEVIDHHMEEEEDETFAEARAVIDDKVAKKMGKQFDDRKKVLMAALEPVDYSQ